jgi:hypothetical protein
MNQNRESDRRLRQLKYNLPLLIAAAIGAVLLVVFFFYDPSYSDAKEAKRLFESGQYEQSLVLAEAVYEKNAYNMMAHTVIEQAKRAIKYERYIKNAREYKEQIGQISAAADVDALKIKLILETAIYEYAKLGGAGYMTPKSLVKEADEYNGEFTALYKELFEKPNR